MVDIGEVIGLYQPVIRELARFVIGDEFRNADLFRESIIENANILIAVLDKGNVMVWNKASETITGYLRDEVIGKRDVWKRLYPDVGYRRTITRQIMDIIGKNRFLPNAGHGHEMGPGLPCKQFFCGGQL